MISEGDIVEFFIGFSEKKSNEKCAIKIKLLKSKEYEGTIIYSKEKYGFIRSKDIDYFYHKSEIKDDHIKIGDKISFQVSNTKYNDRLCAIKLKLIETKRFYS
jgi:cold shock CspA family protein